MCHTSSVSSEVWNGKNKAFLINCHKVKRDDTKKKYSGMYPKIILTVSQSVQKQGSYLLPCQWRTQEFFSGGCSTNSVEDRENGDLGAVAP